MKKRIRSDAERKNERVYQNKKYATDPVVREKKREYNKKYYADPVNREKRRVYLKNRYATDPVKYKAMDRVSSSKKYAKLLREKEARLINQLCKGKGNQ